MKKRNIFLISLLFSLFSHSVFAENSLARLSVQTLQLQQENLELKNQVQAQNNSLNEINDQYSSQKETLHQLNKDYYDLKIAFESQKKHDDSISFSSWASFLLTSVAVIVTVLGVVIALISFVGYREIKVQANAIATKAAEDQVKEKLHGIAIEEFGKLIDQGAFNKQLNSAVDMILRRDDVRVHDELDEYEKMIRGGE